MSLKDFLMLEHSKHVAMTKAERNKTVTADFPIEFHKVSEEFVKYASSGMAAKISNLSSVYMMYLNVLDNNKEAKSQLLKLLEQTPTPAPVSQKQAPQQMPKKAPKPKVKKDPS